MRRIFMDFTEQLSSQSKCVERQVAAVIATADMQQVVSIGLNGGPKGLSDCMCITAGKYGCIHAEMNALLKASGETTDEPMVMFVTLQPCKQCSAAIINSRLNIVEVIYKEPWKDDSGAQLLRDSGIKVTGPSVKLEKAVMNIAQTFKDIENADKDFYIADNIGAAKLHAADEKGLCTGLVYAEGDIYRYYRVK